MKKLIVFIFGFIFGFKSYQIYDYATRERSLDELKQVCKDLDVDILGFLESSEFHGEPRSYLSLFKYVASVNQQMFEQKGSAYGEQ